MLHRPTIPRARLGALAGIIAVAASACDKSTTGLEAPAVGPSRSAAVDSAALQMQAQTNVSIQSWAAIPISAGQRATVTVSYVMTARSEAVSVEGAISQVVFPCVGGCGGPVPEKDGLGATTTIGPAAADGTLTFRITSPGSSILSGSHPNYTVSIGDELGGDMDDVVLSVVIEGGPKLTCTPSVERGQTVNCDVTGDNVEVTGWEFTSRTTRVPRPSSPTATNWSGKAVLGGTVTAQITYNGNPRSLTSTFAVTNRPSKWRARWDYRRTTDTIFPDAEPGSGVQGRNCGQIGEIIGCEAAPLQPDARKKDGAGYTLAQVDDGGPNQGLWYVSEIRYEMRRVANVNPSILANSTRKHTLNAQQAKECRRFMNVGPKESVSVNFYEFNACKGVDIAGYVNGVWCHEERGCNGGTGHQGGFEQAAGLPENDPYNAIEALVASDPTQIRNEADEPLDLIARNIIAGGDPDHLRTGGDWAGRQLWFWDGTEYYPGTLAKGP